MTTTLRASACPVPVFDESVTASDEASQAVLVVEAPIPAGTSVADLLASPTKFLSARVVPAELLCDSTLSSLAQIDLMRGQSVAADIAPGLFLDSRFFQG